MRARRAEVLMFKGLVIQHLYGLSDEQLEYQAEGRCSFRRFMGLDNVRRAPDAKTFREQLVKLGLMDKLFEQFAGQLEGPGYLKSLSIRDLTRNFVAFAILVLLNFLFRLWTQHQVSLSSQ